MAIVFRSPIHGIHRSPTRLARRGTPVLAALALAAAGLSVPVPASAQVEPMAARVAGLTEDVALLRRELGKLRLDLEQVRRENAELRRALAQQQGVRQELEGSYVTISRLNRAVATLREEMESSQTAQREAIVGQVSAQIARLAEKTQEALQALAKAVEAQPSAVPEVTFSEDYPREGVPYTVQPGDTLSSIARRFESTVRDIQNANKIADPSRLQVGQTLFIPQRNDG